MRFPERRRTYWVEEPPPLAMPRCSAWTMVRAIAVRVWDLVRDAYEWLLETSDGR